MNNQDGEQLLKAAMLNEDVSSAGSGTDSSSPDEHDPTSIEQDILSEFAAWKPKYTTNEAYKGLLPENFETK